MIEQNISSLTEAVCSLEATVRRQTEVLNQYMGLAGAATGTTDQAVTLAVVPNPIAAAATDDNATEANRNNLRASLTRLKKVGGKPAEWLGSRGYERLSDVPANELHRLVSEVERDVEEMVGDQ